MVRVLGPSGTPVPTRRESPLFVRCREVRCVGLHFPARRKKCFAQKHIVSFKSRHALRKNLRRACRFYEFFVSFCSRFPPVRIARAFWGVFFRPRGLLALFGAYFFARADCSRFLGRVFRLCGLLALFGACFPPARICSRFLGRIFPPARIARAFWGVFSACADCSRSLGRFLLMRICLNLFARAFLL